jgi:hypothetical protein
MSTYEIGIVIGTVVQIVCWSEVWHGKSILSNLAILFVAFTLAWNIAFGNVAALFLASGCAVVGYLI